MDAAKKADLIVQSMIDKKAIDVEKMEISKLTIIADYFVICSGTSSTHVKGIVDEINHKLKEQGLEYSRIEGYSTAKWVLIDYQDVIVHVFFEEERQYYNLERLWKAVQ